MTVKPREWEHKLTIKCRLCGGPTCKRCSESAALAKEDSPIQGLHADWVTDRFIGMMRPSSRLMNKYKIAQQFHELGIQSVFNLTIPGEHPYCGDGLRSSGFPYDPEADLMAENIACCNFGWEDMTIPSQSLMLDIVKVITQAILSGQKVAVHCHAGYGRTGLAIACALMYIHNIAPDKAIRIVRDARPGSIQTSAQQKFVGQFNDYVLAAKICFALPGIHDRFRLCSFMEQQNRVLHGAKHARLPKIVDFLCGKVESLSSIEPHKLIHASVSHVHVKFKSAKAHRNRHLESKISQEKANQLQQLIKCVGDAYYLSENDKVLCLLRSPAEANAKLMYAVKVAFNCGEANWNEAVELCQEEGQDVYMIALLLDWIEDLKVSLMDRSFLDDRDANELSTAYHLIYSELPRHTQRTLDRILNMIRHIGRGLQNLDTDAEGLIEFLYARFAMAFFQLHDLNKEVYFSSICKGAKMVKLLVQEYKGPKRLEVNAKMYEAHGDTIDRD